MRSLCWIGFMRSVEQEVQAIVTARISGSVRIRTGLMQRIEEMAIPHMGRLAVGSAGAVLLLALALSMPDSVEPNPMLDLMSVGSITPSASRVPSAQTWQVVHKPQEVIALQAPQFQRQSMQYTARSSERNEREDTLTFEPGSEDMPEAKITLRRGIQAIVPSLFIDMTRQQAERGVAVIRASAPGPLLTKFGEIEAADMTFADKSGRNQSCLVFRSSGAMALTGWFCAAQSASVARPEVACFIDRLMLMKSGEDKELRKFFTTAEQKRTPCPTTRISTGRKPTWLDSDGKAPAMRGDVTGSIGATGRKP